MPTTVPVLDAHRFDERKLAHYLREVLPGISDDFVVSQFQGGQSNPTFLIVSNGRKFVLRKKPPGDLLPSAHAVDREFTVLKALENGKIPVPKVWVLCRDESIIGQMFYVMEYVEGRIFSSLLAPDLSRSQRTELALHLAELLGSLHTIDIDAANLASFGKPDSFIERQITRWSKQYLACGFESRAMESLMRWLPQHIPPQSHGPGVITHGDYRIGNVIVDPAQSQIVAVLDWELSTIGHPLTDLAHSCLPYRLPSSTGRGFAGLDLRDAGLPTEKEHVAAYCRRAGRAGVADLEFFMVLALFRVAAIDAGVYRRAIDGNAADRDARKIGQGFRSVADVGWEIAQRYSTSAH